MHWKTTLLVVGLLITDVVSAQTFDERMSDWPRDLRIEGTIAVSADATISDEQWNLFTVKKHMFHLVSQEPFSGVGVVTISSWGDPMVSWGD